MLNKFVEDNDGWWCKIRLCIDRAVRQHWELTSCKIARECEHTPALPPLRLLGLRLPKKSQGLIITPLVISLGVVHAQTNNTKTKQTHHASAD